MPTSRLLAALVAVASLAALPGCDLLPIAKPCAERLECASCASDAACHWKGGACETIEDLEPGASAGVLDPAFCPGGEPSSCTDAQDGPCPTGSCLAETCVREVTGRLAGRYWRPNGTTALVQPGAGYGVTMHAATPDGHPWDAVATVDLSTGEFRAHVPLAPATVIAWHPDGRRTAVVSSADDVDFTWDVAGRPEEAFGPADSHLELSLTGLETWNVGTTSGLPDELQVTTSGGVSAWTTGASAAGTSASFWFSRGEWPLHAPAAGDWAFVHQRSNRAWTSGSTWRYLAASRAAAVATPFAASSYQQVQLALSPPATASVRFDWKFTALASHLPALGPVSSGHQFLGSVSAHPYTASVEVMPPSDLLLLPVAPGRSDALVGLLSYGRLALPGLVEVTRAEIETAVPKTAPGASDVQFVGAHVRREALVSATVATAPLLGPVQGVELLGDSGGGSAFTWRDGVGLRPTLTWSPPALGTPTSYLVRVLRLANEGGVTRIEVVGSILTASTAVTLPPGFLERQRTYFFTVDARQGAGDGVDAPARRAGWPRASSRVVTENFMP